jgi:endonuclease YncB( thermonuclease family)
MARIIPFKRSRRRQWPWWAAIYAIAPILLAAFIAVGGMSGERAAIVSSTITVVDGDTVRSDGHRFRLVGFDTPEMDARCERERTLAVAATDRLRQLITEGHANLERVACACRPGTEGTRSCNYGRLCGVLRVSERDVGSILISEGLAHRYVCTGAHCPRRESWCE